MHAKSADDIKAGDGDLKIRQSDVKSFEVGRNLAAPPARSFSERICCQLIQYATSTRRSGGPLPIVPPWINKFYMLDLMPDKSSSKWCVDQGLTVFVVCPGSIRMTSVIQKDITISMRAAR